MSVSLIIHKTAQLSGVVSAPSSKSHSIRALFLASLAYGKSHISNLLQADDCDDAMQVLSQLGANIENETCCLVNGINFPFLSQSNKIDSGNSGITTHFLMPLLGLRSNYALPITLTCGEQMQHRPVASLVDALRQLGLTIEYLSVEGFLPIKISGKLYGGEAEVAGFTSQYLSALLLALPLAEQNSRILVRNLTERPYVEMTLAWLEQQNIHYQRFQDNELDIFEIQGKQNYSSFEITIPGDFSSASYLLAAAALCNGRAVINGLDMNDIQGDKAIIKILKTMGAHIEINNNTITIIGGKTLQGGCFDLTDIPDLLPPLAVLATQSNERTELYRITHARIKETDRIHSMKQGLRKMGVSIEEYSDKMIIYPSKLKGTQVDGYNDHRTVMALALAGMIAEGVSQVSNVHAINKTFPNFVQTMQILGARMELKNDGS